MSRTGALSGEELAAIEVEPAANGDRANVERTEETSESGGWQRVSSVSSTARDREASWPDPLGADAKHALAGEFVELVGPHSEADPAALLFHFLALTGNAAGPTYRVRVGADEHPACLWPLTVADTASGKGVALGQARDLLRRAAPDWYAECVSGGLISGEGIIWQVRDPIRRAPKGKETPEPDGLVTEDAGAPDKRCTFVETEFASVLKAAGRETSTLSPVLRQAWDGGTLRTTAKNAPAKATGAHITTVAHITATELRKLLAESEVANGFANRFLFVAARRARSLPFGGNVDPGDLARLAGRVGEVIAAARRRTAPVAWAPSGRATWEGAYEALRNRPPGLLGAVTARAAPNVLRLAVTYAMLDRADCLEQAHVAAALAAWRYCEQSARHVFGGRTGDSLADRLLGMLEDAGADGSSRSELRDRVGNRVPAARIGDALALLEELGLACGAKRGTDGRPGRPPERWWTAPHAPFGNLEGDLR